MKINLYKLDRMIDIDKSSCDKTTETYVDKEILVFYSLS